MGDLSEHIPIPREHFTDKFYRRFQKHVVQSDGCWGWVGATYPGGYGMININGINYRAHRVAWTIKFGDIPDQMCVCHHCDNPKCVRPSHLWLGTQQENQEDKLRKGRQARKQQLS
jgi:hypothetical protein